MASTITTTAVLQMKSKFLENKNTYKIKLYNEGPVKLNTLTPCEHPQIRQT